MGIWGDIGGWVGDNAGDLLGIGSQLASTYMGDQATQRAQDLYTQQTTQGRQISEQAVRDARADITATLDPSMEDLMAGFQGAVGVLGTQGPAEQQALALSGASGQAAEQGAMDSFLESPGQQFLRDEQERALMRNSGAMGGLGGGNVRSALQEQAYGRAATNQQQRFNNLATMINPEQQRSVNTANVLSQGGTQLANFRSNAGNNLANIITGGAAQQIPLMTASGTAQAGAVMGQNANVQSGINNIGKTLGEMF
jgi:hypothetical protein